MQDSKRNKYIGSNDQEGKQCQFCSVFLKQGYKQCKYCAVYRHGLAYISVLGLEGEHVGLGESLAWFDFAIREIMHQYHQAGADWKQIESVMIIMVQEHIRLLAEREADQ